MNLGYWIQTCPLNLILIFGSLILTERIQTHFFAESFTVTGTLSSDNSSDSNQSVLLGVIISSNSNPLLFLISHSTVEYLTMFSSLVLQLSTENDH